MLSLLNFFIFFLISLVYPQENVYSVGHEWSGSYNLSLSELSHNSIKLSWNCRSHHLHDKYEITLKPLKAMYKIVETVPRNICEQRMENLLPNTDYQVFVTLFSGGSRRRSNVLTIKTPSIEIDNDLSEIEVEEVDKREESREIRMPQVKVVELSLVGLALILWVGAILLFFHRWGKIRMLLPYQPDFKEKPIVPPYTTCSITPHHQCGRIPCVPPLHSDFLSGSVGPIGLVALAESSCSPMRPRLNSFIGYTPSDIKIPTEIRIYRKAKSAEHLSPPTDSKNYEEIEFADF